MIDGNDKVKILQGLIKAKQEGIYVLDLNIRFGRRQLLEAKNQDHEMKIATQVTQWENVKKGDEIFVEFLEEVLRDMFKELPHG